MKSSFCIDLQRFMLIPTKFPLILNYGNFIQTTFDFIIIAFCIFMLVKGINHLARKEKNAEESKPAPAPTPSNEEKLLTEIRDLLKKQ